MQDFHFGSENLQIQNTYFHDLNVYFDVVKFKCAGGREQIYKAHIRVHTPWPGRTAKIGRVSKHTPLTNSTVTSEIWI